MNFTRELSVRNVLFNLKVSGKYNYHCAVKGGLQRPLVLKIRKCRKLWSERGEPRKRISCRVGLSPSTSLIQTANYNPLPAI
jgi:hypothetical protein